MHVRQHLVLPKGPSDGRSDGRCKCAPKGDDAVAEDRSSCGTEAREPTRAPMTVNVPQPSSSCETTSVAVAWMLRLSSVSKTGFQMSLRIATSTILKERKPHLPQH